ncbi:MAG TPA: sulfite oxidase [Anaerolineae bacterium]|nr:sulfite oxidase [Anaerolineae bacterium]
MDGSEKKPEQEIELLWTRVQRLGMSRRDFMLLLAAGGTASVLAACGGEEPTATAVAPTAMVATEAPPTEGAPTEEPTAEADAQPEPERLQAKALPEAFFILHGTNAEMRWERMADQAYQTDSALFFIRNHAESPLLDPAEWRLQVTGNAVESPLELSYDDLLQMPAQTVTRFIECAGNARGLFDVLLGNPAEGTQWKTGAFGIAAWTGVRLADILERAGLMDSAVSVMAAGLDSAGVAKPMSIEKALQDDTLVVYAMNGGPLPYDHGFPARLLVPGWAGIYNVKWLGSLEVADEQLYSKWNTTSYVLIGPDFEDPEGPPEGEPFETQTMKSTVGLPWEASLQAGEQRIFGYAWSPFGEITQVEVSLDEGQTYQPAELVGPNVAGAGTRWEYTLDAQPGLTSITTRATDSEGNVQWPLAEQVWNQLGYQWGAAIPHPVTVAG